MINNNLIDAVLNVYFYPEWFYMFYPLNVVEYLLFYFVIFGWFSLILSTYISISIC